MAVRMRTLVCVFAVPVLSVSSLTPTAALAADLIRGISLSTVPGAPPLGLPPESSLALPGTTLPGTPLPIDGYALPGTPLPEFSLPGPPPPGTAPPGTPLPGTPLPGTPLPGTPLRGTTALPGTTLLGLPLPGAAVPGSPTAAATPPPGSMIGFTTPTARPPATLLPGPGPTTGDDGAGTRNPSGNGTGSTTPPVDASGNGSVTAAATLGWGTAQRVENFDAGLADWGVYDGPGHDGRGRRSPAAAVVDDGLLTITGTGDGTTAGMAWNVGARYGRWEGRVRAPVGDPSYNALLLLWPDAEDWPIGGELDFMEITEATRQTTELFLHYGASNSQVSGAVKIDATQWHNWAVEWTPQGVTAFVDGQEWWRTRDTSILPPRSMHLCIQLDWFPEGGAVTPSQMFVDWVAFYPLGGSGASTPPPNSGGGTPATPPVTTLPVTTAHPATTEPVPTTPPVTPTTTTTPPAPSTPPTGTSTPTGVPTTTSAPLPTDPAEGEQTAGPEPSADPG